MGDMLWTAFEESQFIASQVSLCMLFSFSLVQFQLQISEAI